jgi:hypothetical protein
MHETLVFRRGNINISRTANTIRFFPNQISQIIVVLSSDQSDSFGRVAILNVAENHSEIR